MRVTTLDAAGGNVRIEARVLQQSTHPPTLRVGFDDEPLRDIEPEWESDDTIRVTATVPAARLWSPEHPHLHRITLALGDDGITTRIGLREVRVEGASLLLNNHPLELRGVCRHESHPQYGPALPTAQVVQDLQLLKRLGCNFVRGSHYPQNPQLLELCDQTGILVFEESLGWQAKPAHFANEHFVERVVQQTRKMVRDSFNHPSVILWGFLNEASSDHPDSRAVYERLVAAIKEQDLSRPVTFASNVPFSERNFDLADFVSVNMYPGWYSPADMGTRPLHAIAPQIDKVLDHLKSIGMSGKPMLISEIGAGAIYGWRDPLRAHWSEAYQADLLETVCKKFEADPRITGLCIWQFCDARTYADSRSIGRPRGFNNKGLFDEYRRPKQAADVVTRHFKHSG